MYEQKWFHSFVEAELFAEAKRKAGARYAAVKYSFAGLDMPNWSVVWW